MENKNQDHVFVPEPPKTADRDWAAKIERALEARQSGRKLRQGKPVAFPTQRMRP